MALGSDIRLHSSELEPDDVAIIREVYDGDYPEDVFRMELEKALQIGCRTIVIEPAILGSEIRRWIEQGSLVKKVSMTCGLTAFFFSGFPLTDRPSLILFFGLTSGFLSALHFLSWQTDPCHKYRLESRRTLSKTSLSKISSFALGPTVLVRKKSSKSNLVLALISCSSFAFAVWKVWQRN